MFHRAQIAKEWFREHDAKFSHMNQRPGTPDLNPIENLWDGEDFTQWPDSPIINRDRCGKLMQRWTETNVVTLYKLVKVMPQCMLKLDTIQL